MNPAEAIENHTVDEAGCHIWATGCQSKGYGLVTFQGVTYLAHRFVYEAVNGPIPEGAVLRHTCDVPNCVNPDHLIIGTQADNMRDRAERGYRTKLTDKQIIGARLLREFGFTYVAIGDKLGLTKKQVENIIIGKVGRHVK